MKIVENVAKGRNLVDHELLAVSLVFRFLDHPKKLKFGGVAIFNYSPLYDMGLTLIRNLACKIKLICTNLVPSPAKFIPARELNEPDGGPARVA